MKNVSRLLLSLGLVVCIACSSLAASAAEVPAAVPAVKEDKVVTELSGSAATSRTQKAMLTNFCTPYCYKPASTRTPADLSGAEPDEGAVAVLQLFTTYHPKDNTLVNTDGHAFLCIRNVSDHDLDVGGRMIAPGTGVTVGTRGNRPEHTGIWYNLESYYIYYLPDFYPNRHSMQVSLNEEQLAAVNDALAASDKWSALNNCIAFVSSVWNAVCSDELHPALPTPEKLTLSMERYEGKVTADADVPYDYIVSYGIDQTPSQDYR